MPPRKRPHPAPAPKRDDKDNNRPFDAFYEDESDEDDYAMSQPAAKKARTGKGKGKEKAGASVSKAASKAATGKAGDGGESLPFLSLLRLAVCDRLAGW